MTPCKEWPGAVHNKGYGQLYVDGTKTYAHRKAWEDANGPIPEGLHIDHLCRNRLCVEPTHLEPVTPAENQRRGKALITHCPQGHEYTEANTYIRPGTQKRHCRECKRDFNRIYARKRRASNGR